MPITEILVLTFTERAAAELRQRIRSKIESILLVADEGAQRGGRQPGDRWLIDEVARQNLSRALFSFDGASIGTIHGFFGQVLTEHAFTNGRLFDGNARGWPLPCSAGHSRRPCAARSPVGRVMPLICLHYGWNTAAAVSKSSKSLLWTCQSSRRQILPSFSIEATQREIESSPLFEIDLAGEAEQFKARAQSGEDQCQYRSGDDASDDCTLPT